MPVKIRVDVDDIRKKSRCEMEGDNITKVELALALTSLELLKKQVLEALKSPQDTLVMTEWESGNDDGY